MRRQRNFYILVIFIAQGKFLRGAGIRLESSYLSLLTGEEREETLSVVRYLEYCR